MFDPNTYKDEWNKTNNTSDAGQTSSLVSNKNDLQPTSSQPEQNASTGFHNFDGSKAEVSNDLAQKLNGPADQIIADKPENIQDLESEADEIINATAVSEAGESDNTDTTQVQDEQVTVDEISDDPEVVDDVPESPTDRDNKNLTGMETTLLDTADAAKFKIDEKISEKKQDIEKLNSEIVTLGRKKEELDKLASDLKDKLKRFDEEINEI